YILAARTVKFFDMVIALAPDAAPHIVRPDGVRRGYCARAPRPICAAGNMKNVVRVRRSRFRGHQVRGHMAQEVSDGQTAEGVVIGLLRQGRQYSPGYSIKSQ